MILAPQGLSPKSPKKNTGNQSHPRCTRALQDKLSSGNVGTDSGGLFIGKERFPTNLERFFKRQIRITHHESQTTDMKKKRDTKTKRYVTYGWQLHILCDFVGEKICLKKVIGNENLIAFIIRYR
jgi:hypothetical protein